MANYTSNMDLILPTSSTSSTYGTPAQVWAGYINQNFFISDSHNHTNGNGALIPSSSLTSASLNASNFRIKNLYSAGMSNVTSQDDVSDCSLYMYGDNLWYKDGSSNNVQITDGDTVVEVTTDAGFYGDYETDSAKAVYYLENNEFYFYNGSNTLADIYCYSLEPTSTLKSTSLTSSVVCEYDTSAGNYVYAYFPNATNICPGSTGGWQSCFSTTSQTGFSYPYVVVTDTSGGVTLPDMPTEFSTSGVMPKGDASIGFSDYVNVQSNRKPYLTTVMFLQEIISEINGWSITGDSTNGVIATRTFLLSSDYTPSSTYTTKKLLGLDTLISFYGQASGTVWVNSASPFAVVNTTYFRNTSDGIYVDVTVSAYNQAPTGYNSTTGAIIEVDGYNQMYIHNVTYGTYHALKINIRGLVRSLV